MSTILSLAPQNVWNHFYSLTQIPRPSGHMEKITEFLINFGKGLGLESFVDEAGNVIIRKPATPGMENRKGVILQAHMDMVPQKNNDTVHDFEKDPIEIYVQGSTIVLKKFEPNCIFCGNNESLLSYQDKLICPDCARKIGALERK